MQLNCLEKVLVLRREHLESCTRIRKCFCGSVSSLESFPRAPFTIARNAFWLFILSWVVLIWNGCVDSSGDIRTYSKGFAFTAPSRKRRSRRRFQDGIPSTSSSDKLCIMRQSHSARYISLVLMWRLCNSSASTTVRTLMLLTLSHSSVLRDLRSVVPPGRLGHLLL